MSAVWPWTPPGVSTTTGAPASRTTSARAPPSMWPDPRLVCRSAPVSNSSRLSLQCTRSTRPVMARTFSTTVPRSLPPPWAWQVSRQKPTVSPPSAPPNPPPHRSTPPRPPRWRDRLQPPRHRVVAACGVLDEEGHRHLEPVDALPPVVEADGRVLVLSEVTTVHD